MPAFLLPTQTRAATLFNFDPNSLMQTSFVEYSTGVDWLAPRYSAFWRCDRRFSRRGMPDEISKIYPRRTEELKPLSYDRDPFNGASREIWQHSIPPLKDLRCSIMMRTLRAKP